MITLLPREAMTDPCGFVAAGMLEIDQVMADGTRRVKRAGYLASVLYHRKSWGAVAGLQEGLVTDYDFDMPDLAKLRDELPPAFVASVHEGIAAIRTAHLHEEPARRLAAQVLGWSHVRRVFFVGIQVQNEAIRRHQLAMLAQEGH